MTKHTFVADHETRRGASAHEFKDIRHQKRLGVHLCVEGYRRPLCVLRHFVSVVEVVAEGGLLMFVHQVWVGAACSYGHCQQTVNYDIRVPMEERTSGQQYFVS